MKKLLAAILGVAWAFGAQAADQRDVQGVLDKYGAVRPKDADLAIYQLDWSPTLKAAKEKAAKGERPIFLVVVINSFGNVCSGHC
jgi:hypothetical protein